MTNDNDIEAIAQAEQQAAVVDQQAAASAVLRKGQNDNSRNEGPKNAGVATTQPDEGPDDVPPPLPASPEPG